MQYPHRAARVVKVVWASHFGCRSLWEKIFFTINFILCTVTITQLLEYVLSVSFGQSVHYNGTFSVTSYWSCIPLTTVASWALSFTSGPVPVKPTVRTILVRMCNCSQYHDCFTPPHKQQAYWLFLLNGWTLSMNGSQD